MKERDEYLNCLYYQAPHMIKDQSVRGLVDKSRCRSELRREVIRNQFVTPEYWQCTVQSERAARLRASGDAAYVEETVVSCPVAKKIIRKKSFNEGASEAPTEFSDSVYSDDDDDEATIVHLIDTV